MKLKFERFGPNDLKGRTICGIRTFVEGIQYGIAWVAPTMSQRKVDRTFDEAEKELTSKFMAL